MPIRSSVVCVSLQILGEPSGAPAGPILASAAQASQEEHAFPLRCARTRDIARGAGEWRIVLVRHIPRPRTARFVPSLAGSLSGSCGASLRAHVLAQGLVSTGQQAL